MAGGDRASAAATATAAAAAASSGGGHGQGVAAAGCWRLAVARPSGFVGHDSHGGVGGRLPSRPLRRRRRREPRGSAAAAPPRAAPAPARRAGGAWRPPAAVDRLSVKGGGHSVGLVRWRGDAGHGRGHVGGQGRCCSCSRTIAAAATGLARTVAGLAAAPLLAAAVATAAYSAGVQSDPRGGDMPRGACSRGSCSPSPPSPLHRGLLPRDDGAALPLGLCLQRPHMIAEGSQHVPYDLRAGALGR